MENTLAQKFNFGSVYRMFILGFYLGIIIVVLFLIRKRKVCHYA